jgi:hypothetical protein
MVVRERFAECRLLRNCGRGENRETNERRKRDCLAGFAMCFGGADRIGWDENSNSLGARGFGDNRLEKGRGEGDQDVGSRPILRLQR